MAEELLYQRTINNWDIFCPSSFERIEESKWDTRYLVSCRIPYARMIHQSDEEQWSPKDTVRGRYHQKHFHPLNALPLHSLQVVSHFPVLLCCSASL